MTAVLLAGCASHKHVAYFQNSNEIDLSKSQYLYDARIMPKDQLTITVSTTNDEAAVPFNLTVPTPYTTNSRSTYSQAMLQTYLVDNEGNINYPILGQIHVGGLTKSECEKMIQEKVKPFMAASENPIVTVRMTGYQISVIGEVARPGQYQVYQSDINLFQALALAGNATDFANKKNVKIVHQTTEGSQIVRVNLNDANILENPQYYLKPNDIIYVEPMGIKRYGFTTMPYSTIFSAASLLITVLTFFMITAAK